MSCEKGQNQAATKATGSGIARLAAKAVFYAGVGLMAGGTVVAMTYQAMKFTDQAFSRNVSRLISQIQRGAAIAHSALAPETPHEARSGILKEGVTELIEAWGQIKGLRDGNKELKDQLISFLADMLAATEEAEMLLDDPGDQVRLEGVRQVFRSSRLVFLLPRRANGNKWRTPLLVGATAGLAASGIAGLAKCRYRQTQDGQVASVSAEFPQIASPTRITANDIGQVQSQSPSFPLQRVEAIDWRKRRVIGGGGLGIVYEVAPGVVAKVGDIALKEAETQRYFARQGLALPVLDYQEEVELPRRVSWEACPVHGQRKHFLPEGYSCTCGSSRAVLLMLQADDNLEDVSEDEIRAFMLGFSRDCEQQLGHYWDARPANVARYQGHLVALDFGEEEG